MQRLVTEAIEEFTGVDLSDATNGADGCGIPTFTFPAHRLAYAMARLVTPSRRWTNRPLLPPIESSDR